MTPAEQQEHRTLQIEFNAQARIAMNPNQTPLEIARAKARMSEITMRMLALERGTARPLPPPPVETPLDFGPGLQPGQFTQIVTPSGETVRIQGWPTNPTPPPSTGGVQMISQLFGRTGEPEPDRKTEWWVYALVSVAALALLWIITGPPIPGSAD